MVAEEMSSPHVLQELMEKGFRVELLHKLKPSAMLSICNPNMTQPTHSQFGVVPSFPQVP